MNDSHVTLGDQIESLVRAHIEAMRRVASEAVERALSTSPSTRQARSERRTQRAVGRRRTSSDMFEVGERLYEAVCTQPGETMAVLAPGLGETPRELHRPMMTLKQAGRVRSVGQRQHTRYYPTVGTR